MRRARTSDRHQEILQGTLDLPSSCAPCNSDPSTATASSRPSSTIPTTCCWSSTGRCTRRCIAWSQGWLTGQLAGDAEGPSDEVLQLTAAGRRQLAAEESNWQRLCLAIGPRPEARLRRRWEDCHGVSMAGEPPVSSSPANAKTTTSRARCGRTWTRKPRSRSTGASLPRRRRTPHGAPLATSRASRSARARRGAARGSRPRFASSPAASSSDARYGL